MPNAIRGLHSPSGPALIPLVSHSVQTVVGGKPSDRFSRSDG